MEVFAVLACARLIPLTRARVIGISLAGARVIGISLALGPGISHMSGLTG